MNLSCILILDQLTLFVTAQEHKDVTHSFDTWHGAKNFGKKLGSVSKTMI